MKRNYKLDAVIALEDVKKREQYLYDKPIKINTEVEIIGGIQFIGTPKQLRLYRSYYEEGYK